MAFIPLNPCCLQGGILIGTPGGKEEPADERSGRQIMRYHATPTDGKIVDKKAAVILFTDGGGLGLHLTAQPNCKIMADAFADQLKLNVFVPAYIADPPPVELFDTVAPLYPEQFANRTWATTIWNWVTILWRIRRWLPSMLNTKFFIPFAEKSVHDLQKEGFENIAAVGYCRGGAMIEYLLASGVNSPLVGGVICHPSPEISTWAGITKPTKWHLADHDPFFTEKKIEEFKHVFEAKVRSEGIEFDYVVHKVHGFASRPTLDHELTKIAFEEANASAVAFFKKHLLGEK